MADRFATVTDSPIAPARNLAAVTPNDSTDLAWISKAIYVGVTGDLSVIAEDDTVAVTFTAVPAGTVLPIRARRVMATGTTASSIVNLI